MGVVSCHVCGKKFQDALAACPDCEAPQRGATDADIATNTGPTGVTFGGAISMCLSNYVGFSGRATRSEFWYFWLFWLLLAFVSGIFDALLKSQLPSFIVELGLLLPFLAVTARRLHDTGHSGWWQLLYLTIVGNLLILYWAIIKGDRHTNKFGPPPP